MNLPKNIKKTIDNTKYCHKHELYIEEDDYAILNKYCEWANCDMDEAINGIVGYSLRIVRNILKYHKDYTNLDSLIEHIAIENDIDLSSIKKNEVAYKQLYTQCKNYCENRCEYTPYERSYWYDILLEMIKTDKMLNNHEALIRN